jgi:hypothetical protein
VANHRPPPAPGHPPLPVPKCPSEADKLLSFGGTNLAMFAPLR